MRKLKLYLESSVINVSTSDQDPRLRDITIKFIEQLKRGDYEGYQSYLVLDELNRTPGEGRKQELLKAFEDLELEVLDDHPEIESIANQYIKEGLITEPNIDDARHVAIATYYDMDAIISWNCEHIVKFNMKKNIALANSKLGYRPIEIITPEEVG